MLIKRTISLLLLCLILFADGGQLIYAHTCFKSNQTSFSLYSPAHCKDEVVKKACCSKQRVIEEQQCELGKMDCCSVTAKFVKHSFPTTQQDAPTFEPVKASVILLATFLPFLTTPIVKPTAANGPPPLLRLSPTSFLQVFRC